MNNELINKIHEAIIDMMKLVDFDEELHRYTRKIDGKWLAGVSIFFVISSAFVLSPYPR